MADGSRMCSSGSSGKDSYYPEHQEIHGGFNTKGKKGALQGYLYHHTYETIYAYVEKMNEYTSLHVTNKLKDNPQIEVPLAQGRAQSAVALPAHVHLAERVQGRLPRVRAGAAGCELRDAAVCEALGVPDAPAGRERPLLPPTTNAELNVLKKKNA